MPTTIPNHNSTPTSRLVSTDGRELVLQIATLRARAGGGLARVCLEQTFTNPYSEPLHLTYLLPLPADGAVRGFAFTIGERRIEGQIDRRQAARERFEQAIVEGRTAALLEQDRSSLFTQELGNVPPGATVVAEVEVDQPLVWVGQGAASGEWEWRFPTTVAPRYLGSAGRVPDGERMAVDVLDGAPSPRLLLDLTVADALTGALHSPSHDVVTQVGATTLVGLVAEEGSGLDRDVVIRWPASSAEVGVCLEVAGGEGPERRAPADHLHGLLTLVPPLGDEAPAVCRDVTILFDTSGSMSGEPLEQARAVVCAVVESLGVDDRLEMIEFSNQPRRWKRRSKAMKPRQKADALAWLRALRAGGGTEMHSAILEATRAPAAGGQRQIVLVTDGLIGFEQEIVASILDTMPSSSRFHAVAVGSAPNRSLTQAAARAGRGIERGIQLGDDPVPLARELVARTAQPVIVDLELSGSAFVESAPERMPDLFAGAPARIALRLRPEGGELVVRGRRWDGGWERRLQVAAAVKGGRDEIVTWFAREKVEDLEMRVARGEDRDSAIEAVALDYRIASRLTSWVAVDSIGEVDPQVPTRKVTVAHELPLGMSVEGLGLRAPSSGRSSAMRRRQGPVVGAVSPAPESSSGAMPSAVAPNMPEGTPPPPLEELASSAFDDEAPPPAKKQRSRDAFGGKARKDKREDSFEDAFEEGVADKAVPLPELRLRGRLIELPDGAFVLEFEWHGDGLPVAWELPERVTFDVDGVLVARNVLEAASTQAGPVPGEATVRVVLAAGEMASAPQEVSFSAGGVRFHIVLSPAT